MIKHAVVKQPGKSYAMGITTSMLGKPKEELVMEQHQSYCKTLEGCGCVVDILPPDDRYPDSTFVEDTAVVTKEFAVITKPCAKGRQGEEQFIIPALKKYYQEDEIHHLVGDACLDGGDVMQIGDHFYIGLSKRTNAEGFRQFSSLVKPYGYRTLSVPVSEYLHLKTGVVSLDEERLLVAGEFKTADIFSAFDRIVVDDKEAYGVNCIAINGVVIMPGGFPKLKRVLQNRGYCVVETPMSEFEKMDGGLTCLSVRIPR